MFYDNAKLRFLSAAGAWEDNILPKNVDIRFFEKWRMLLHTEFTLSSHARTANGQLKLDIIVIKVENMDISQTFLNKQSEGLY